MTATTIATTLSFGSPGMVSEVRRVRRSLGRASPNATMRSCLSRRLRRIQSGW